MQILRPAPALLHLTAQSWSPAICAFTSSGHFCHTLKFVNHGSCRILESGPQEQLYICGFTERTYETQHRAVLMAKIFLLHRCSKAESCRRSLEEPACRLSVLSRREGSHRARSPPPTAHVRCFYPGKLIRDAAPKVFVGLGHIVTFCLI